MRVPRLIVCTDFPGQARLGFFTTIRGEKDEVRTALRRCVPSVALSATWRTHPSQRARKDGPTRLTAAAAEAAYRLMAVGLWTARLCPEVCV